MDSTSPVIGDWSEKWKGSWFKPQCGKNMEGVQVAGEGARVPSEYYRRSLEQGTEPPNGPIALDNEFAIYSGVYPAFTHAVGIGSSISPGHWKGYSGLEKAVQLCFDTATMDKWWKHFFIINNIFWHLIPIIM